MKRYLAATAVLIAGVLYLGVWAMLDQNGSPLALVGNHALLGSADGQERRD